MFSRLISNPFTIFLVATWATAVSIAPVSNAQEAPAPAPAADAVDATAADSTYLDLRRSKDRATQQWAERYFNLIKVQEWTSDKGTKIKAKYVSHTPDLKSVTLAIVRGIGAERTETEKVIPVARLNKTSQSRVKQIATTQKKLDELLAGGAKGEPVQPGAEPSSDPGSPMVDERGVQPGPRRPPTPRRPARPNRAEPAEQPPAAVPSPAAAESSTADDGNPDPLGFGDLPANPAAAIPAGAQ